MCCPRQPDQLLRIEIVDAMGHSLKQYTFPNQEVNALDMTGLPGGVYMVRVHRAQTLVSVSSFVLLR